MMKKSEQMLSKREYKLLKRLQAHGLAYVPTNSREEKMLRTLAARGYVELQEIKK